MNSAKYTFISPIDSMEVVIDENRIVTSVEGSVIAQGYIGSSVSELIEWLREYGDIRFEREDLMTGHVGKGNLKEDKDE